MSHFILENFMNLDNEIGAFPVEEDGFLYLKDDIMSDYTQLMEMGYVFQLEQIKYSVVTENTIKNIWDNIKKFFKTMWDKIKSFFQWIKNLFKNKIQNTSKELDKLIKDIENDADEIVTRLKNDATRRREELSEGIDEAFYKLLRINFYFVKSYDKNSQTIVINRSKTKYNFPAMLNDPKISIPTVINSITDALRKSQQDCQNIINRIEQQGENVDAMREMGESTSSILNMLSSIFNKKISLVSDIQTNDIINLYVSDQNTEEIISTKILRSFLSDKKGPYGASDILNKTTKTIKKLESEQNKFLNDISKKSSQDAQYTATIAQYFSKITSSLMNLNNNLVDIFAKALNESIDMYKTIAFKELRAVINK